MDVHSAASSEVRSVPRLMPTRPLASWAVTVTVANRWDTSSLPSPMVTLTVGASRSSTTWANRARTFPAGSATWTYTELNPSSSPRYQEKPLA